MPKKSVLVLVCAFALILGVLPQPAPSQSLSLEDTVIKAFEVTADLRPVALPGKGTLKGKTVAALEVTADAPVATVRVLLNSELTVKVSGAPLSTKREGHTVVITFDPALQPRSTTTLTFEYEGKVQGLWDELLIADDGLLYPVLISAFGDISANRAHIKTTVTIPAGYQLASSGQTTRDDAGGLQTYRWDSGDPLPYVAVVGGRGYQSVERRAGETTLTMFLKRGQERFADQIADATQKAAAFYGRLLYPFPFARINVVSASFPRGLLGLGFPGLMLLSEEAFNGTGDLGRESHLFQLVAHEAAHTYFPSQTSGKGIAQVWLSEGFAEYLALMATEAVLGRQAFLKELDESRRAYAKIAGQDKAISAYTRVNSGTPDGIAVRYAKGAFVLHMLRFVVGRETFNKILSTYATRFRGQSVRVDDFAQTASDVAGKDLGWFFDEWISQRVLPDYMIPEAASVAAEGAFRTTAKVKNQGTGAMPVDVLFEMEGGEKVVQRVDVGSGAEVVVTVTTSKRVQRVVVDPEKWILQANYGNDAAPVR